MHTVSVVIVSYNVCDLLVVCIQSLQKHAGNFALEVIVVDNNSTDNSCAVVKTMADVTLIENKFNAGFSAANNQGIAVSKGDYILLLNPDTELKQDVITTLIANVSTQHTLIAPQLLNSDGSLQLSCFKFPSVWFVVAEALFLHVIFRNHIYKPNQLKQNRNVEAVSGAAILFHKSSLKNLHGLDPQLFWMEDIDFCYRNFLNGNFTYYVTDVNLIHHSGKSSTKNYHIVISNQILSKLKYLRKHSNAVNYYIAVVFSFIHIISRLVALALFYLFSHIARIKFKAYFFSLKKFFKYFASNNQTIIT
ncbi:MAG: glycosyltransferase family 2 protein [Bacteroidia bacterium]|nr:glycosyltransferase family 2 protein [Bacteroidia bacterium]